MFLITELYRLKFLFQILMIKRCSKSVMFDKYSELYYYIQYLLYLKILNIFSKYF